MATKNEERKVMLVDDGGVKKVLVTKDAVTHKNKITEVVVKTNVVPETTITDWERRLSAKQDQLTTEQLQSLDARGTYLGDASEITDATMWADAAQIEKYVNAQFPTANKGDYAYVNMGSLWRQCVRTDLGWKIGSPTTTHIASVKLDEASVEAALGIDASSVSALRNAGATSTDILATREWATNEFASSGIYATDIDLKDLTAKVNQEVSDRSTADITFSAKLTTAEDDITNIQSDVTDLQNDKADKTEINTLASDKADKTALDAETLARTNADTALDGRVTTLEGSKARIETIANNANSKSDTNKADIATIKPDLAAVKSKVDDHNVKINTNTSDIQTLKSIVSVRGIVEVGTPDNTKITAAVGALPQSAGDGTPVAGEVVLNHKPGTNDYELWLGVDTGSGTNIWVHNSTDVISIEVASKLDRPINHGGTGFLDPSGKDIILAGNPGNKESEWKSLADLLKIHFATTATDKGKVATVNATGDWVLGEGAITSTEKDEYKIINAAKGDNNKVGSAIIINEVDATGKITKITSTKQEKYLHTKGFDGTISTIPVHADELMIGGATGYELDYIAKGTEKQVLTTNASGKAEWKVPEVTTEILNDVKYDLEDVKKVSDDNVLDIQKINTSLLTKQDVASNGGTDGQLLSKTTTGTEWVDAPVSGTENADKLLTNNIAETGDAFIGHNYKGTQSYGENAADINIGKTAQGDINIGADMVVNKQINIGKPSPDSTTSSIHVGGRLVDIRGAEGVLVKSTDATNGWELGSISGTPSMKAAGKTATFEDIIDAASSGKFLGDLPVAESAGDVAVVTALDAAFTGASNGDYAEVIKPMPLGVVKYGLATYSGGSWHKPNLWRDEHLKGGTATTTENADKLIKNDKTAGASEALIGHGYTGQQHYGKEANGVQTYGWKAKKGISIGYEGAGMDIYAPLLKGKLHAGGASSTFDKIVAAGNRITKTVTIPAVMGRTYLNFISTGVTGRLDVRRKMTGEPSGFDSSQSATVSANSTNTIPPRTFTKPKIVSASFTVRRSDTYNNTDRPVFTEYTVKEDSVSLTAKLPSTSNGKVSLNISPSGQTVIIAGLYPDQILISGSIIIEYEKTPAQTVKVIV